MDVRYLGQKVGITDIKTLISYYHALVFSMDLLFTIKVGRFLKGEHLILAFFQVYALGGFLVLRWIWARWKERRPKDESSGEPSAGDD